MQASPRRWKRQGNESSPRASERPVRLSWASVLHYYKKINLYSFKPLNVFGNF